LTSLRGWPTLEEVRPSALANGLPMASACVMLACTVCRTCGHICASIIAWVVVMGRRACGVFRSRGARGDAVTSYHRACVSVGSAGFFWAPFSGYSIVVAGMGVGSCVGASRARARLRLQPDGHGSTTGDGLITIAPVASCSSRPSETSHLL
jgi:hypothetical protein